MEVNADELAQLRGQRQAVDARRDGIRHVLALLMEASDTLEELLVEKQGDVDIMPENAENDEERETAQEIIHALEHAAEFCGTAISACEDALGA
jgi:hypothetical protein